MILIYIFAISACVVFGMLLLKVYENRRKKITLLSSVLSGFDDESRARLEELTDSYSEMYEQSGEFLKEKLPQQTKYFFQLVQKNIEEQYQALLLNARGSRALRTGDASSFLKDIAKHKKENGGGRIEDNVIE